MEPFRDSLAGRLLTIAGALPLAAGAAVLWDSGGMGTVVIITAVFTAILLGICGLGLALEDYGGYAVAGVLFLPPALFLYTPLVAVAMHAPVARFAMAIGAVMLFAVGLRGTVSGERSTLARTPDHRTA